MQKCDLYMCLTTSDQQGVALLHKKQLEQDNVGQKLPS